MARKAKIVATTFPEKVKTRIFGRNTRLRFIQEPSVEAFKCSNNSKHGDQFAISHLVVQPQLLRSNDIPDKHRSDECTAKGICYESGQGLNPNSVLDQGLNPSSNKINNNSHRAQSTRLVVETRKDIPVRVNAPQESRQEFKHVTLCNNTVQADLGMNPASKLCSSAATKVKGSSIVVPGVMNGLTYDSADSTSDFIPIYDINHAG